MAGSFISTFMSFFPQKTQWFCLIGLFVFFWGIYVPYDKYKQKKKKEELKNPKPPKQKPVSKPVDWKQMEQLDTLRNAGLLTEEEYRERVHKL